MEVDISRRIYCRNSRSQDWEQLIREFTADYPRATLPAKILVELHKHRLPLPLVLTGDHNSGDMIATILWDRECPEDDRLTVVITDYGVLHITYSVVDYRNQTKSCLLGVVSDAINKAYDNGK